MFCPVVLDILNLCNWFGYRAWYPKGHVIDRAKLFFFVISNPDISRNF